MIELNKIPGGKNNFFYDVENDESNVIEQFNNDEKSLYKEIKEYFEYFIHLKKENKDKDYSKYFFIFSYNLFNLGLEEHGQLALKEISDQYYENQLIKDMESAVEMRNKADQLERLRKTEEAQDYWKEAEFFLVAVNFIPKMVKMNWEKKSSSFKKFMELLRSKKFEINLAPQIKLI